MIMAGGMGSRLGFNAEKPLLEINGRKMISYVIDALLEASIDEIFAAVSPRTPETRDYLIANYSDTVKIIEAPGTGYVSDYIFAAEKLGIKEPFLLVMADLPLITGDIIKEILEVYRKASKPALAVYVPLSIYKELGLKPGTVFKKMNRLLVPGGVNILHGALIRDEQDEYVLITRRKELAINVNTLDDLKFVEKYVEGSKCQKREKQKV